MPRGNGTGPMTGRAAGYCAGFERPGFANFGGNGGFGCGMGRGAGFGNRSGGFGFRKRFFANGVQQVPVMTMEQEKEYLAQDAKALENDLKAIKQRLDELND